MTKFGKILVLGIGVIVVIVTMVVFWVDWGGVKLEKTDQKDGEDMIVDSKNFIDQILNIKEIREKISSSSLDDSEMQEWKSYTSEKLGISFKYPSDYLVMETEKIRIFKNTPDHRRVEKILNLEPEPWSQVITFNKSINGGFTQDIVQWYKENKFGKNADSDVYAPADFIGVDAVAYRAEGLFMFDGIFFEKGGSLYQFSVQYFNSPESPRDNFYKIISTIEFKTLF